MSQNSKTTQRLQAIKKQLFPESRTITTEAAASKSMSRWNSVPLAPADPILGLTVAFNADTHPDKLNLGVGAYRTEELKPWVIRVVRKVEKEIANGPYNKEYIPQEGLAEFLTQTQILLFGRDHVALRENRVGTVQSISGTGALKIGFEFIRRFLGANTAVYVSNPSWGNHHAMIRDCGLQLKEYRYWDPNTKGLNISGLLEDLQNAPEGSVILLHVCAHNPTGVDPTMEQWAMIADVCQARNLVPFFDGAYQGFATGDLNADAASVRMFADRGIELFAAQSYAKNFGLYGERIGAFSVVTKDTETTTRVVSQLKIIIRRMYSSPPIHGARIVAMTLSNPENFALWEEDLKIMAHRIIEMRALLFEGMKAKGTPGDWSHIVKQIGMFSFTGLNPKQVKMMTDKFHIYMTGDGRISMAGLNRARVQYLIDAIHDVVVNPPQ